MDRFELAKKVLADGQDQLVKSHSMQELQALFCTLVKAPQAPKFSDKTAAAKRVLAMAAEVEKSALIIQALSTSPFGDTEKVVRGRGRPKAGPRTYTFKESQSVNARLLPKQARVIVDAFPKDEPVSSADLEARVHQLAADGLLKTKQDPVRIFLYYRAKMISCGWLRMQHD